MTIYLVPFKPKLLKGTLHVQSLTQVTNTSRKIHSENYGDFC